MIVDRVERHQIKKHHELWKLCDEICYKSKNLYNYANYLVRQEFIKNSEWIRYNELNEILKEHESYRSLMAQVSQQTLKILDKNWKSFFRATKEYERYPKKFTGRPKLPKYKDKDGRFISIFTNQNCKIKNGYIQFPKCFHKYLLKTKVNNLQQVRIVPEGSVYYIEVVYQMEVPDQSDLSEIRNIVGIDLGIDNFVTMANNIGVKPIIINGRAIKSINRYYNKRLYLYIEDLKKRNKRTWSKRLDSLTLKRNNKVNDYIHKSSKKIIDWCVKYSIDVIVIGKNNGWKTNNRLNRITRRNFNYIPHALFIDKLIYKAENLGIRVICTEESYTSGTSFLNNETPDKSNYKKSRRIKRGLFRSNEGILINADLNGAYQIIKKVFPNAFADGIEGVGLHPVRVQI